MKKSIVMALATAMVVGAASTTFAAANPFSDVPQGHWAYDYVSQLAADGVIEGYGDTTFQGDKNITRYEMATMIAKAMAKPNVSGTDKAMLDKLAAEFSDELNNLGVRVANLERNADKVKWNGEMQYKYTSARDKDDHTRDNQDQVMFRLEPSAEVNNHWHVNARIDAYTKMNTDASAKDEYGISTNEDKLALKRIWAQGDYGNFGVKVGKFAPIDDESIADTQFSGGEFGYHKGGLGFTAGAGRISGDDAGDFHGGDLGEDAANYQYAALDYEKSKLYAGAHFHHLNGHDFDYQDNGGKSDDANIWLLKGSYQFDQNWGFNGYYGENSEADFFEKIGNAEIKYKGADQENKNTWGAWVAYRHLGENALIASTYDAVFANQKAWEVGTEYVPFANTVATLRYANGKDLATDHDIYNLFGTVEFFF